MQKNMKQIIFTLTLLSIGHILFAQNEKNGSCEPEKDTTKIKIGNSTVIIVNSIDTTDIDYDFGEWDHQDKDTSDWGAFLDIGMTGYLTEDNKFTMPQDQSLMELSYPRSWSVSFSSLYQGAALPNRRLYIYPGVGIAWHNYFFENNVNISTSNTYTEFTEDSIREFEKFKMSATYLQIPIIVGTSIGNTYKTPLNIQVGIIGGYKIGSKVKQRYVYDDARHKEKIKDDYNLNPFKVEAIARIAIGDVGLYAKYAITTLFEENKAAELYPFSAGITFGDFKSNKKKNKK